MLSENDITTLHGMFGKLLRENNEIFGRELQRDIRDEVHALISASESRVIHRLEGKIQGVKEAIIDGVIDILDRDIYPRLNEYDRAPVCMKGATGIA